jgi:hypothetical protein
MSECLVVLSRWIRIGSYGNQWFKYVVIVLRISVKTSLWPMCTSLFFGYTITKNMVWRCLPWFEDGLKTCPWPMCKLFNFGCKLTNTLVWRCSAWFKDVCENRSVANVLFICFRLHKHENHGLKMFALIWRQVENLFIANVHLVGVRLQHHDNHGFEDVCLYCCASSLPSECLVVMSR